VSAAASARASARAHIAAELAARIAADVDHYVGALPHPLALAWRGYLAAMLEWDLIRVGDHDALLARLPPLADDPAVAILRGRD
jgi:hypothetical protein